MIMNENLARLVARLETTTIPTVKGQLRDVVGTRVCMCPLGHLVDLYIQDTPGAEWLDHRLGYFQDPNYEKPNAELGFPTDQMLTLFNLTPEDAYRIYRQNDGENKTPAEIAEFIRGELV